MMTDGKWWSSSSGCIELRIPAECAADINHPGPADAVVDFWLKQPEIEAQMDSLSADTLASELRGYGVWEDEELADHEANLARLLWIAACDVDEMGEDDDTP
jgi:hypothetical protein